MSRAEIASLVVAGVAFLGAAAAYLRAHTTNRKLNNIVQPPLPPPTPPNPPAKVP